MSQPPTYHLHLDYTMTLRAPLSHIGGVESNVAMLVREPIRQPDGTLEEVPVYSGNGWRGQLRDLLATRMLALLHEIATGEPGIATVPLEMFHLLYGGGALGASTQTDLRKARQYTSMVPLVALLGGGVGSQILEGKLRFNQHYPLCREALPVLAAHHHERASTISLYDGMTYYKAFTRMDDSKRETLIPALRSATPPALIAQSALFGAPAPAKVEKPEKAAGTPQQMRYETEVLAAGTVLAGSITGQYVTEPELGCLVSGLRAFADRPHIGGKSGVGLGLVDFASTLTLTATGAKPTRTTHAAFAVISGHHCLLSPVAEAAEEAYHQHLHDLYQALLSERLPALTSLLGVSA